MMGETLLPWRKKLCNLAASYLARVSTPSPPELGVPSPLQEVSHAASFTLETAHSKLDPEYDVPISNLGLFT